MLDRTLSFHARATLRFTLALGAMLACAGTASARRTLPNAAGHPMPDATSSIVVDAATGQVLSSVNADAAHYPASLTKLMTLYMLFEALRDHRVTLDQQVPISAHAASLEPSKLGLLPGMRMTVEQGILGIVTKSANDDAAALGELLGGDEPRFAQMMTLRARALGMAHTTFRNASGLPDPDQVSTARDLAVLARHLVQDFPGDYAYFSTPSFVFHGQTIFNHDRMLITYPGADGMKTGYTQAAGHNLVTSALHGSVRLIGVVLGARTNPERDVQMAGLLNAGFAAEGVPSVAPPTRLAGMRRLMAHMPSLIPSAEAASMPIRLRHRGAPTSPVARQIAAGSIVQLGSFTSKAAAERAAIAARHRAGGGTPRVTSITLHGRRLWRVQLIALSAAQSHPACTAAHPHDPCPPGRPVTQVASR